VGTACDTADAEDTGLIIWLLLLHTVSTHRDKVPVDEQLVMQRFFSSHLCPI
jgi:hypothetical protein